MVIDLRSLWFSISIHFLLFILHALKKGTNTKRPIFHGGSPSSPPPIFITLPNRSSMTLEDLLSDSLLKSMYVSFLAGCFRSVRFGLEEAHGKGQALQFNWLYEKGAFILHSDNTVSVDFSKIEGAVESLSREILTIQAKGDKEAAGLLLQKYSVMTEPLKIALKKLESVQVPVDVAPTFPIANEILK